MSHHKIGVAFLVLTAERKRRFFSWALEGFMVRLRSNEHGSGLKHGEQFSANSPLRLEEAECSISSSIPEKIFSEPASGQLSTPRETATTDFVSISERANGHLISCTCKGCERLVIEAAREAGLLK